MAGVTWRLTYEAALGNLDPTFTPSHTPKLGEKKDGGGAGRHCDPHLHKGSTTTHLSIAPQTPALEPPLFSLKCLLSWTETEHHKNTTTPA